MIGRTSHSQRLESMDNHSMDVLILSLRKSICTVITQKPYCVGGMPEEAQDLADLMTNTFCALLDIRTVRL
jgi:hypothetical protein